MDKTGWTKVKLGDICEYVRGLTYNKNDESEDGIGVLRANNISLDGRLVLEDIKYVNSGVKIKPSQYLKKGDIFICAGSGSKEHIGKVTYITEDMNYCFGGFMAVIRSKNNCLSRYLLYILQSQDFRDYLKTNLMTSTINNLKASLIYDFECYLPPMEIQIQIAKLLTTIDNIIQSKLDESTKYQNMKTQIMNDIFANGEREQNWTKVKLGDIATFINGKAFKPSDWTDDGLPIIRIQNLTSNAEYNYYNGKIENKYLIFPNDIIFSWSATIDAFIYKGCDAVLNQHLFKVIPKSSVDHDFLYHILKYNIEGLKSLSHGIAMMHLKKGDVESYEIPLPPMEIQLMIANLLTMYDAVIDTVKKEKEDYEKIKTQMMNMIFA